MVFSILVVINFIVITKGSGRVAEVAARFTLDAMPGKQMSIDADLNAGLINEQEARARRKEIETEADFYGSMDGASKFVRGDAIAGIIPIFSDVMQYGKWYHAAPSFLNLSLDPLYCNRFSMFKSLQENAAIVSSLNLEKIAQSTGIEIKSIVFAGGASKGFLWPPLS